MTHNVQETAPATTDHRPWPKPAGPWLMFQSWQRLLFAHWPVPAAALRSLVPKQLELDEYDGRTYLGLTPFDLRDLHLNHVPGVPTASNFLEVNLRTYVRVADKPGIFFFSLDAASRLAVLAARLMYHLPYFSATMSLDASGEWFEYRSRRHFGGAELHVRYRPDGVTFTPTPGSLEHFLTERYALYVVAPSGSVMRGDIHHEPWRLHNAVAEVLCNTISDAQGISLSGPPPLLHYSARQDTVIWPLTRAE